VYGGRGRRIRADRKIHNALVTNYVLPHLRSPGLRCVAGMKTGAMASSRVFSRAYFSFESWTRIKARRRSVMHPYFYAAPRWSERYRSRGNKKVDEEKRPCTLRRSRFLLADLGGILGITECKYAVVSWWDGKFRILKQ